jgi:hypothetical protein
MIETFLIVVALFLLWSLIAALWGWARRSRGRGRKSAVVALLACLLASGPAWTDPPEMVSPPAGTTADTPTPDPGPGPETPPDVTFLKKGKPAPHTGLLVLEGRFTRMLKAEGRVAALEGEVQIERNLRDSIETLYRGKLEEAVKPPPWYESKWVYFTLGVVVTAAAIYGGAQLVKAVR